MEPFPELILIACEGKTESLYFNILQKAFRLPTWVKIIPDPGEKEYENLGQHETLFKNATNQRQVLSKELDIVETNIETWAVCDRDNYTGSYTKLKNKAKQYNINLAFSDPQFENFLLQHLLASKSASSGKKIEQELSQHIMKIQPGGTLYKKNDLSWLENLIDQKHATVKAAVKNADMHTNHTKQPFFTAQRLVERLLDLSQ